eukprot:TRINITY_DN1039_c0_g1_i4.p1 TRINITY_DN1039_c0_g1~~TRINITY_DN1039_c0_g1_i4.p1  ORF type:complete len:530 (-),score=93.69 TRINITY_DN1039_c0_g1_i4:1083-2672(-)
MQQPASLNPFKLFRHEFAHWYMHKRNRRLFAMFPKLKPLVWPNVLMVNNARALLIMTVFTTAICAVSMAITQVVDARCSTTGDCKNIPSILGLHWTTVPDISEWSWWLFAFWFCVVVTFAVTTVAGGLITSTAETNPDSDSQSVKVIWKVLFQRSFLARESGLRRMLFRRAAVFAVCTDLVLQCGPVLLLSHMVVVGFFVHWLCLYIMLWSYFLSLIPSLAFVYTPWRWLLRDRGLRLSFTATIAISVAISAILYQSPLDGQQLLLDVYARVPIPVNHTDLMTVWPMDVLALYWNSSAPSPHPTIRTLHFSIWTVVQSYGHYGFCIPALCTLYRAYTSRRYSVFTATSGAYLMLMIVTRGAITAESLGAKLLALTTPYCVTQYAKRGLHPSDFGAYKYLTPLVVPLMMLLDNDELLLEPVKWLARLLRLQPTGAMVLAAATVFSAALLWQRTYRPDVPGTMCGTVNSLWDTTTRLRVLMVLYVVTTTLLVSLLGVGPLLCMVALGSVIKMMRTPLTHRFFARAMGFELQ